MKKLLVFTLIIGGLCVFIPKTIYADDSSADILRARIIEMTDQIGAQIAQTASTHCTGVSLPYNLTVGSRGYEVQSLQSFLDSSGYGVPVSGYYDMQTAQAVLAWKNVHGIDWLWTAGTIKSPWVTDSITRAALRNNCQ